MEPGKTIARKWIAAGIIVCAFLVADFVTPIIMQPGPEWPAFIMLGICIGQVNLIATWAALAPGNVVLRLPWAFLLSVLMWYGLVLGVRVSDVPPSLDDAVITGIFLLGGVVSAQIPLWIAGRLFRWRLVSWAGAVYEPSQHRMQYQLWHLMLGILFVSIALAPGRVVLPQGDLTNLRLDYEMFAVLALLVVCNLLIAVPCIWGAFARATIIIPLALGWIVYCVVVTAVEYNVLGAILGPGPPEEMPYLMYVLNVSQCATVFGTLLILRALGFHLLRVPSRRAQATGQSPFRSTAVDLK
jgi:hypothetical protein